VVVDNMVLPAEAAKPVKPATKKQGQKRAVSRRTSLPNKKPVGVRNVPRMAYRPTGRIVPQLSIEKPKPVDYDEKEPACSKTEAPVIQPYSPPYAPCSPSNPDKSLGKVGFY
jgi:hypothetical protein